MSDHDLLYLSNEFAGGIIVQEHECLIPFII